MNNIKMLNVNNEYNSRRETLNISNESIKQEINFANEFATT